MGDISPCPGAKIRVMTEAEERRDGWGGEGEGVLWPHPGFHQLCFLSCIVVIKELGKPQVEVSICLP